MNKQGMTLLELTLALSILTFLLVGVTVLNLSVAYTSLSASLDVKMEEEFTSVFRDMELYLKDGIIKGALTQRPDGSGNFPAGTVGPLVYRGTDSRIWLGVLNNNQQEVWYGYAPVTRQIIRRIFPPQDALPGSSDTILSAGILGPYSLYGPDVDGDKAVTSPETTAFNTCMASSTLALASCEGQSLSVYPVFQVKLPDRQIIYISFQGKGTTGQRESMTKGMTKTLFLHASAAAA